MHFTPSTSRAACGVGLWLCLVGCHSPSSSVKGSAEVPPTRVGVPSSTSDHHRERPPSLASPCDAPSSGSATDDDVSAEVVSELQSPRLTLAARSLANAVAKASAAMRGVHKTSTPAGLAGVDFALSRLVLRSGSCQASLRAGLASEKLEPASVAVAPLSARDADTIDSAFEGWLRGTNSSGAPDPTPQLASAISRAAESLRLYATNGQHGPMRISGVALVDETSREAIWIFARVVEPIVERRR